MELSIMASDKRNVRTERIIQHQSQFQPYSDNGGNVIAIAGQDYALIASDTRLTYNGDVCTRDQSKLFKINEKTILGSTGCWCDVLALNRVLEIRTKMYRYDNNQEISSAAAAQLLSITLYNRRFFPYYVYNVLAGMDENGKGYVYRYDPVGCIESVIHASGGSAASLIQPLLDNQISKDNIENLTPQEKIVSLEEAIKITKDVFVSAAEREITCGDGIHICIITKDGIKEEKVQLRKD